MMRNLSLRIARALAPVALFVALPVGALAQAGAPARPGMAANPVFDSGCPPVTEAQCRDPEFLWNTPCGQRQRDRSDSPCALLLGHAMGAAASRDGQRLSVVPRSLTASGVDRVVEDQRRPTGRTYVPDLLSFHSRQSASGHVATTDIGINEYDLWRNNGTQVASCDEYVWEKFADVNEFLHATRGQRHDLRALFDVAYGPASNPASIGNRHLADPHLRGRDGRSFGRRLDGTPADRNAFYRLQNYPGFNRQAEIPTNVPGLLDSLAARSAAGAVAVQRIQAARANQRHRIAETWAWHRSMSERFVRRPSEGLQHPGALLGIPPANGFIGPDALGVAGLPGHRRYLDEELNEFWRLQDRARELERAWARASTRFGASGWTVAGAGLAPAPRLPGPPRAIDGFRTPPQNPRPGVALLAPVLFRIPDPETVVRKQILDELIEILTTANTHGCLSGEDAPCDWSTERFARIVLDDVGAHQDRELQRCNAFSAGNLQNVLRLNVPFVDDPDYPEYACSISAAASLPSRRPS